jgi:hypothetical protein
MGRSDAANASLDAPPGSSDALTVHMTVNSTLALQE